ncbi:XRE family transcriptional regulator [Synechococcus sp. PCC 7336]|uniref:XRE family transcriptional regulator n=1 Tax=Synechococcus sp. PCC 7336 TaxID=195250 RepID=UPI000345E3DA|nr:XRE family transcriptional regulator [Synechococcus sp. PCC 7336]
MGEPITTPFEDILAQLPEERRARIEQRTEELIAREMALQQLRESLGLSQPEIDTILDMNQDSGSRLDKQRECLISTLREYIVAAGGHLRLVAEFSDDRPPIDLSIFANDI